MYSSPDMLHLTMYSVNTGIINNTIRVARLRRSYEKY